MEASFPVTAGTIRGRGCATAAGHLGFVGEGPSALLKERGRDTRAPAPPPLRERRRDDHEVYPSWPGPGPIRLLQGAMHRIWRRLLASFAPTYRKYDSAHSACEADASSGTSRPSRRRLVPGPDRSLRRRHWSTSLRGPSSLRWASAQGGRTGVRTRLRRAGRCGGGRVSVGSGLRPVTAPGASCSGTYPSPNPSAPSGQVPCAERAEHRHEACPRLPRRAAPGPPAAPFPLLGRGSLDGQGPG